MVDSPAPDPHEVAATSRLLRLRRRLTAAVAIVGFGSALLVYVFAGRTSSDALESELESKSYLRDMEIYGGKWNLLAKEFREWFVGLWHGQNLAFTITVMTVLLVVAIRLCTTPMPQVPEVVSPTPVPTPPRRR